MNPFKPKVTFGTPKVKALTDEEQVEKDEHERATLESVVRLLARDYMNPRTGVAHAVEVDGVKYLVVVALDSRRDNLDTINVTSFPEAP